jgi:hypothetical protein
VDCISRAFILILNTYCSAGIPITPCTFPICPKGWTPKKMLPNCVVAMISGLRHVCLQLSTSPINYGRRSSAPRYVLGASSALFSLRTFSLWVTSVYYHVPPEKVSKSGFGTAVHTGKSPVEVTCFAFAHFSPGSLARLLAQPCDIIYAD